MTQQDAACCALVVMPSVTEESSSTSFMLSTEQLAGSDPVPIDRVSNVPEDGGPTEVTDHSILMELGLVDKYGRPSRDLDPVGGQGEPRAGVGEPGYPSFEPNGGLFQAQSSLVGGFRGQELAVGVASSVLPNAGEVAVPQWSVAGRELGMSSQLSLPNAGVGTNNLHVYSPMSYMDVPPYPFSSRRPMLPESVVNEFAREGVFGFSPDDERVTVSRREYTELVQSRQHAENMLKIIHDLETKCAQHEHELQKCKDVCIETCKRVEGERDRQINSIVQRYETRFKDDHKRFETEFVQLRAQCNIQVTKMSQQYEHSVSLLNNKTRHCNMSFIP